VNILKRLAAMDMSVASIDQKLIVAKAAVLIAGLVLVEVISFLPRRRTPVLSAVPGEKVLVSAPLPRFPAWQLLFAAVCVWLIILFGTFSGNTFIYFQF
jgi:hypothetical protein